MGMFDSFVTDPPLTCPLDGRPLPNRHDPERDEEAWQGKSGPCALHIYREGRAWFDEDESRRTRRPMCESGLPARFEIHNVCGDHQVTAEGRLGEDGTWSGTRLLFVLGPARGGGRGDIPVWGSRPEEPLWPHDACARLSADLAAEGRLGPAHVAFLREDGGFRVTVDASLPDAAIAAIPARFAGRPVHVERAAVARLAPGAASAGPDVPAAPPRRRLPPDPSPAPGWPVRRPVGGRAEPALRALMLAILDAVLDGRPVEEVDRGDGRPLGTRAEVRRVLGLAWGAADPLPPRRAAEVLYADPRGRMPRSYAALARFLRRRLPPEG